MCELHSGGKFDDDSYKVSGGLHGVGVSVVNFLSEWLHLEIRRDGGVFEQEFQRGVPTGTAQARSARRTRPAPSSPSSPTPQIFSILEFHHDLLVQRLRELAFLNPGLIVRLFDERGGQEHEFVYKGGIAEFVEYLNRAKTTLHPKPIFLTENNDADEQVAIALQWHDGYNENVLAFTNTVFNADGGTHLSGFRSALTRTINAYAQANNLVKNAPDLSGEDVREGLTAVLSVKIRDPKFSSQTKDKLVSSEVKGWVESVLNAKLAEYFEENPTIARKIISQDRRGRAGARGGAAGSRADAAQGRAGELVAAGQAGRLSGEATRPAPSCTWSRETRPAARRSRGATGASRRSCRCAARSSTSRRRASTRCWPTRRSAR